MTTPSYLIAGLFVAIDRINVTEERVVLAGKTDPRRSSFSIYSMV